jgi:HicB family
MEKRCISRKSDQLNEDERSKNDAEQERTFSGRFPVRIPRYLHRRLTEVAQEQGVSLNQFVCTAAAMVAGLNSEVSEPDRSPGSDRVTDEEFSRLWQDILA